MNCHSTLSHDGQLKAGFKLRNPPNQTRQESDRAKDEFLGFASATLNALIQAEERELRSKSGLRLFCRLDVGLLEYEPHTFHYWACELDRTQNASLWACGVTHKATSMASTFSASISDWLAV